MITLRLLVFLEFGLSPLESYALEYAGVAPALYFYLNSMLLEWLIQFL